MGKLNENCGNCGMAVSGPSYHPLTACYMYRGGLGTALVNANLRQVVEYGMKAQARGVDLDAAMADISNVLNTEAKR